ncbi:hypothetical protein JTB14_005676 [Gonioctena quinquepunctata]|nr:hypothetical protein JTB14_005676 [Gonioctena quinquepunctata]
MSLSNIGETPLGEDSRDLPNNEVRYFEDTDTLGNIRDSELESALGDEDYLESEGLDDKEVLEVTNAEVVASLGESRNHGRQLPRISVMIGGQVVLALIDTGASVNFIRSDLVTPNEIVDSSHKVTVFLGCSNTTSPSRGRAEILTEIEGREYAINVTVLENLNERLILSMPFLTTFEATIDLGRKCLYFGLAPRQTVFWDRTIEETIKVLKCRNLKKISSA